MVKKRLLKVKKRRKNLWKRNRHEKKPVFTVEKEKARFVEKSIITDIFNDVLNDSFIMGIFFHVFFHILEGINDGGMVAVIEFGADLLQGELGNLPHNVNSYLPRI